MRITEKLMVKDQLISFEVFPPKTDSAFESIEWSVRELSAYNPDFMSVTYGAGGGTSQYTTKIASLIKNRLDTTALAHLTCASTPKDKIKEILDTLKENHIDNILAMRGDIPQGYEKPDGEYYEYAYELVKYIKEYGYFDIGGACYPECHPECESLDKDIDHLKLKVDSGVDFLITQLFYDNDTFYSFLQKVRKKGIYAPVFAGIMPITNIKQIDRIISLSGTKLPCEVSEFLEKYKDSPEDLEKAGLDFAIKQINDLLANGVNGIHIYTMNKPYVARTVLKGITR
ncbi:MAG: methylenetetrahydrofolate reductase [Clostridia bacterium]|nr:methylenetetrahydrofolate reductase [NAD(P)H] [Clostridia bacterium]